MIRRPTSPSMTAAILYDPLRETFHIWILNAKVKDAGLPVLEIVLRFFGIRELEEFDADLVTGSQVRDPKPSPAFAERVVTHDANRGIIGDNFGGRPDNIRVCRE